ncbi:glycoside hydrolase family 28 protein [Ferruginibacter sp. HRS2-29]|uniref:glycoside hydrolase family 28 protein n=1 Tax=Ferruginibacter sp. HRS2-29 TaxID=2487334 RepID=UPI0020CBD165|nr:glycoside hydrolase family 28 protein [Ferruginibacter sp. HRS2-29]MCP9752008.1 glycoside hydrolase family 28 protein [Ferruginibacter sp. HRS2-29]
MIKKWGLCGLLACMVLFAEAQKLPVIRATSFKKDTFNIIKYGAKADGITLNTKSITDAIDACSKKGGGVVVVPPGLWLTGPLVLKSNVNLCVQRGAILQFTDDKDQYKVIVSNWEGLPAARNESPISATNATNIAITGAGIIDGNGDAWRAVKKDKLTESQWRNLLKSGGLVSEDNRTWYPSESSKRGAKVEKAGVLLNGKTVADYDSIKDFLRPNLLVITNCDRILLDGVTFQNSAAWCLHPLMSSNITIKNITVRNPWYAQNGDGIDLESCRNVLLENSSFDVGDDGICIKSGRDAEGRKRAMPTQDVIVRNCVVYHAHGGFVIGSEMSGGAKNIFVDNCAFIGTDIGLRFKTTRGRGGIVENIFINNIAMRDIPGEAILFDMYYMAKDPIVLAGEKREAPKVELKPVTDETPRFRNFDIKNVVCYGASKAIFIRGLPEMNIHDINLSNITITAKKGIEIDEAQTITMNNVKIVTGEAEPLIGIYNSSNISFSKFTTTDKPRIYLRLGGEKTSGIRWLQSPVVADSQLVFEFGATKNALQVQ